jgi:hypothetical protein
MSPHGPPRPRRLLRLGPALAPIALLALLATPGTALADCMMPPPVEEVVESAEIVFVGTVNATTNRGTWANVTVEEVWRGPDQPSTIVVHGGPAGNAATSVDRGFEVGVKYLFFPYADAQVGLADNSCTSTQPWAEPMAALRPADARQPTGEVPAAGFDVGGIVGPLAVAIVVGGLLFGVALLARGRDSA